MYIEIYTEFHRFFNIIVNNNNFFIYKYYMHFSCKLTYYCDAIFIMNSPFHRDCLDPATEKENTNFISKIRKL